LSTGRSDHVPCNGRFGCPLVSSRAVSRHGNTLETSVVLQVSIGRCQLRALWRDGGISWTSTVQREVPTSGARTIRGPSV